MTTCDRCGNKIVRPYGNPDPNRKEGVHLIHNPASGTAFMKDAAEVCHDCNEFFLKCRAGIEAEVNDLYNRRMDQMFRNWLYEGKEESSD